MVFNSWGFFPKWQTPLYKTLIRKNSFGNWVDTPMLLPLKIRITSWAIFSLAGDGLGKVKEGNCQGEKEKKILTSHLQQNNLGLTMSVS